MTPLNCNGVICNYACESCGFNPSEQKRRLETGRFEMCYMRHVLHNDRDKPIHTAKNLCKRLIFKKGVSKDNV